LEISRLLRRLERRDLADGRGRVRPTARLGWRVEEIGFPCTARVSVSRSIFPIVTDTDRACFRRDTRGQDQLGWVDGAVARSRKTYPGEPEQLVAEPAQDEARVLLDPAGHPFCLFTDG